MQRRNVLKRSPTGKAIVGKRAQSNRSVSQEEIDPVTRWATLAAYEFLRFPDHERDPLAGPDIVYARAGNIDLRLEVITAGPVSQARPTVIFFHGGGWGHLMKEDRVMYLFPYLAQGMNAINVEYRLANQSPAPAAVEDARCALRWVHQHAEEYGFDPGKLVVSGESAGGHQALMTGMLDADSGFDHASKWTFKTKARGVAAIVNFFGIADVADVLEGPHQTHWAVEWLGGLPNRCELAKRLSPLSYVRKGLPPIISIHGTADLAVPYDHSVRLHQALDKAGVSNQLVTVPNGAHGNRNWSREENLRAQVAVFKFLKRHGVL